MGSLLKRGVDPATAKDACQEVAILALTKRAEFDSAEHFYRWLNKVAHRVVSKWQRKAARISGEEVPDSSSPDLAGTVERRALLSATVAAIAKLSDADREALLTAVRLEQRGGTRRERDRISLRVHRARRRLHDRLEGWWAGLPWWRWLWSADPAPLAVVANTALGAAAITLGAMSGWLSPHQATERPAIQPISAARGIEYAEAPAQSEAGVRSDGTHHSNSTTSTTDTRKRPAVGPLDHRVVVIPPAGAPGTTEGETRPRHPKDDALMCWGNVPRVPDGCIAHPLRRDGQSVIPQG